MRESEIVTSTTGVQRGASVPVFTLHWAPVPWVQRTVSALRATVRRSVAAARDFEDARTPAARNAVLERFAAER